MAQRVFPFLGHLHLLGKTPHQDLHKLDKKHDPIMYKRWGLVPVIIVSSPEIAELALKTYDHVFADRPYHEACMYIAYGQRNLIFSKYGSNWLKVQKMCTLQLLSSHKINSLLIGLLKCADGAAVDLSAMVSSLSADMSFLMVVLKKYLSEEIGEKGFVDGDFANLINFFEHSNTQIQSKLIAKRVIQRCPNLISLLTFITTILIYENKF